MKKIFSDRLKHEREFNGYTQEQFAKKLGLSQSTYAHYELLGTENGREPSMEIIKKIAIILEVSIDYLFGLDD